MFDGLFERIEVLGYGMLSLKHEIDSKMANISSDMKYNSHQKFVQKRAKKINEFEHSFKDSIKEIYKTEITFDDLKEGTIEYTTEWPNQFDWISRFILKVISKPDFNPNDIEKEDVIKWINMLADPDVQKNAYAFDVNHQTNLLHWVMQQCSNLLYERYPGYEDLFLDKEEALRKFNINLLSKQMESGKNQGDQIHLMVKLPDEKVQINMPTPYDDQTTMFAPVN